MAFVLAVGDRDSANKNKAAIFVSSIAAKDFSHGVLLDGKVVRPPPGRVMEERFSVVC